MIIRTEVYHSDLKPLTTHEFTISNPIRKLTITENYFKKLNVTTIKFEKEDYLKENKLIQFHRFQH
jgi:hypothetical protein